MPPQTGSFDMPAGPGQGNGSGGAKGIKGTVASADFGSGIATGGKGDGRSSGKGRLRPADLERSRWCTGGPKIAQADSGPASTPVEITFKPNPVYTDEARSLKLEGEVLLEVSFSAQRYAACESRGSRSGARAGRSRDRRRQQDPI